MVQKFVKDFIVRTKSHDVRLLKDVPGMPGTEEPALDQPSYIDKERHASEDVAGNGDAAASSVDVSSSLFSSFSRSKWFLGGVSYRERGGDAEKERSDMTGWIHLAQASMKHLAGKGKEIIAHSVLLGRPQ